MFRPHLQPLPLGGWKPLRFPGRPAGGSHESGSATPPKPDPSPQRNPPLQAIGPVDSPILQNPVEGRSKTPGSPLARSRFANASASNPPAAAPVDLEDPPTQGDLPTVPHDLDLRGGAPPEQEEFPKGDRRRKVRDMVHWKDIYRVRDLST